LINQLLLAGSSILIYEFLRYIKLIHILKSNLKIYHKIFKLFKFKKVSDFRKEKLIFNYSKKLFLTSIKIIVIFILIVVVIFIMNLLSESFLNLIFSILGIIEFSFIITFYHIVREKIDAKL
tara:strand:+ start:292 stop:657 length:366 start_codon:yes stop_codon:yes gene_type:complete